jgi:hypothetical protein
MYSKFPGLDVHINEEKISNIENSITQSLLDNTEKPNCKFNYCYIIVFIFIGASAAVITYACIKLFT